MPTFSQTITHSVTGTGIGINSSNTYSGDGRDGRSIAVADSTTDLLVDIAINVSEIQSIYMRSSTDLKVETNDATTPDETINLLAGKPYVWSTGSYFANLLATDITKLFLTNASGAAATFDLEVVIDSTP